jgi:serine/threonine protein kinase/tetratricopeptide (TPR) repeat protein
LLTEFAPPSRFRLLRRIGEGGMGIVYEAMDQERGERVALKTIRDANAEALLRLKREFRALQGIHHPNLVTLGELFSEGAACFFTMELIEGTELLPWIRGRASMGAPSGVHPFADTLPAGPRSRSVRPGAATAGATPTDRPPPAAPDESRVRGAFRQLALGLSALHDAGKVHRDVKPSNVRVTAEGRVVLLDFGLVLDGGRGNSFIGLAAGTPAYMAPEQATSTMVGPAADWYSVGVALFECLTGKLPFEGAPLAILMAKQRGEAPRPRSVVPDVPVDLDALCNALLHFSPEARPDGPSVLRKLAVHQAGARASTPTPSATASPPFVGREPELGALQRAFADVRAGATVTVALHGESGVGKSCAVRRFLEEATAHGDDVLVLAGRCYEREAVPYKALDDVVDALARLLARMPNHEAAVLVPTGVASLAQAFPALCRVPEIAQLALVQSALDPHDLRTRAFASLRDLFTRLGDRHPLVIVIDDLHWSDADSLSLLAHLLRGPDAPRLLLVVTSRTGEVVASLPGDVRRVHVERLAQDDARDLATKLLGRNRGDTGSADAIAREAAGHPMFIDFLVRHTALSSADAPRAPRLDDALREHVLRLDEPARRLLEVVCLVGAPLTQDAAAHASGLDASDLGRALAMLRVASLVRTSGPRLSDAVEPFHDRVRESVVARLDPTARHDLHERIAATLEASRDADHEVLAVHWRAAGHPERACEHSIAAAEEAARALAFNRAARLYADALELLPAEDVARRCKLLEARGDALANSGDGVRAADEYERAADGSTGAEALDLRRRVAEQLLRCGVAERGLATLRAVVAAVGMRVPETFLGAVVQLLLYRLVIRLRGLGFEPRDEREIPASELTRIDVCWSASLALSYIDSFRGAVFQSRHLLLALRAGERARVARALGAEAGYSALGGKRSWRRTEHVIARGRDVAESLGTPYARATVLVGTGVAYTLNSRFVKAVEALDAAVALYRDHCPGSAWEATTARFFAFCARAYEGQFRALRGVEAALEDALARGDRYGALMLRIGVLNVGWLVGDDPASARRHIREALDSWPVHSFQLIHIHALMAECRVDLYEGASEAAYARIMAAWRDVERSPIMFAEALRVEAFLMRARCSLGLAEQTTGSRRAALLREMRAALRKIAHFESAWMTKLMFEAGALALEGHDAAACGVLDRVIRDAARFENRSNVPIAQWLLATRTATRGDTAALDASASKLMEEGVACIPRFVRVIVPGFGGWTPAAWSADRPALSAPDPRAAFSSELQARSPS